MRLTAHSRAALARHVGAVSLTLLIGLAACSTMQKKAPEDVIAQLAPGGTLRAAINFGNPILAYKDPLTSAPSGVSVDLATALAERLGVHLRFVPFESAGSVVAAARSDEYDVAFVAVDPIRGKELLQTAPYVMIEGAYMVRSDSPIINNDEVDQEGIRVAVATGSAYDLYLTRVLKHASLLRARTSPEVTDFFLAHKLDVAAGVKQQLEQDALRVPGLRLLPGRFMRIDQAMATPLDRPAGARYLDGFIAEMKQSGFVAAALKKHGIEGAMVAP